MSQFSILSRLLKLGKLDICVCAQQWKAHVVLHAHWLCRRLKQDTVPTVAYSDSFGEGGGSGTLGYYLASAFDQIYVQETGLVSFTGLPICTSTLLHIVSDMACAFCILGPRQ